MGSGLIYLSLLMKKVTCQNLRVYFRAKNSEDWQIKIKPIVLFSSELDLVTTDENDGRSSIDNDEVIIRRVDNQ